MRSPYTQLYLHLVWATWDRLPLISETVRPRLYAALAAKAREFKCHPLEIGGIDDHVHVLLRVPATVAPALLAKELKGSSSHLVTHEITHDDFFKWQGGYGAFSVGKAEVNRVRDYIKNQAKHHGENTIWPEWERTSEEDAGD